MFQVAILDDVFCRYADTIKKILKQIFIGVTFKSVCGLTPMKGKVSITCHAKTIVLICLAIHYTLCFSECYYFLINFCYNRKLAAHQGCIIGTKRKGAWQAHSVSRDISRHIFAVRDCAHSYRATEVQDHHSLPDTVFIYFEKNHGFL